MATGRVFNLQRFSLQDGPGIRTTIFLKGCPLRCAWCHNPEGISSLPEFMVIESRCIGCLQCRLVCPHGAVLAGDGPLPCRSEPCIMCGSCSTSCPTGARKLMGEEFSTERLLSDILKDLAFYEASGGGVTFSGGEPLQQPAFLLDALAACRNRGLHTAVDTCGLAPLEDLLAAGEFTNLFLYDIKCWDEERHQHYTGVSNRRILENLKILGQRHSQIWVRIPVIPGVNDDPLEFEAIAQFAATIPGVRQVNLLPYHRIGVQKAARMGEPEPAPVFTPPSAEVMVGAMEVFNRFGLLGKTGGY